MTTTIRRQPGVSGALPPVPTLRLLFTPGEGRGDEALVLRPGATPLGRDLGGRRGLQLSADGSMSRLHATIHVHPGGNGVTVRDEGSTNGTFVNGERVAAAELGDGDLLRVGDSFLILRLLGAAAPRAASPVPGLLGEAPAALALRADLHRAAPGDATVLLLGETGTGKEVAARALHELSPRGRAGQPFVVLDCGAVSPELIESELFGHERGAFTGAGASHEGIFEQAGAGTLFIDELGELPLPLQPKLLRVLEGREFRRVGGARPRRSEARVVAATNRDLRGEVEAGRFRPDLYARVAELTIELPALRARREDVLPLLYHALSPRRPALSPDLVEALLLHRWPFNVREVYKLAVHLGTFGGDGVLGPELLAGRLSPAAPPPAALPPPRARAEAPSRDELLALFLAHEGSMSSLSRALGKSRRQIYRWLEQHQIDLKLLRRDLAGRPRGRGEPC